MKKCLILFLMLAMLTGCAPSNVQEPEDGKLHIVATVFPAYDFARAAAGDLAEVELLLPPQATMLNAMARARPIQITFFIVVPSLMVNPHLQSTPAVAAVHLARPPSSSCLFFGDVMAFIILVSISSCNRIFHHRFLSFLPVFRHYPQKFSYFLDSCAKMCFYGVHTRFSFDFTRPVFRQRPSPLALLRAKYSPPPHCKYRKILT